MKKYIKIIFVVNLVSLVLMALASVFQILFDRNDLQYEIVPRWFLHVFAIQFPLCVILGAYLLFTSREAKAALKEFINS